jgi:hypothetical protein
MFLQGKWQFPDVNTAKIKKPRSGSQIARKFLIFRMVKR